MISEIINGNCIEELPKILKKYNEREIVLVSDPPFNVGYHYKSYKDNLKEDDYYELLKTVFGCIPSVIIHYPEALHKLSRVINKTPVKVVSWVYNSNTAKQHRDIVFYDVKPDFRKVTQPYKNPNDKRIKARIAKGFRGGAFI